MADKKTMLEELGLTAKATKFIAQFFGQKARDLYYRTRETLGEPKREIVEIGRAHV